MAGNSALHRQLEKRYCPPLDTATFLAIVGDYDLADIKELTTARQILDTLTEGADLEEASGFDPSGSSSGTFANESQGIGAHSDSTYSLPGCESNTDSTSLSLGPSGLDIDSADSQVGWEHERTHLETKSQSHDAQLENLNLAEKEAVLIDTFPGLKPFDVKWTLKKCKENAGRAIEELLNEVFLEESGSKSRGIEGFSEDSHQTSSRRAKGKKKRLKLATDISGQSAPDPPSPDTASSWENGTKEIEFISSRMEMPSSQVTSIYHSNGASLRATISAIIQAHLSLQLDMQDPLTQRRAQDLLHDFPSIPLLHLIALIQLTAPSLEAARELASALTLRLQPKSGSNTPIQIEFRHPPPELFEGPLAVKPSLHNKTALSDVRSPTYTSLTAEEFAARRNSAFTKASAAYRKARSDPLMGGAAAYYSSIGRDNDARAKSASSAEADRLVASQSSIHTLDLHGVDVKNAERIARERVTNWWARLRGPRGETVGLHSGYRIVTGKGTHSEGGRSRLGPAVAKMLIREGWKVEVASGYLTVSGVVSRG